MCLRYSHPQGHAVVTGGGASCNAGGVVDAVPRWVACRPGFYLPVRVLRRVFRGKFLAGLRRLFDKRELVLTCRWSRLSDPRGFAGWLSPLFAAMAFDLFTRRRVHPVHFVNVAVLTAAFLRIFFMESEGWLRIGRALLVPFV